MSVITTLELPDTIKKDISAPGMYFGHTKDGGLIFFDFPPKYGEPHYPISLFLSADQLQKLGINKSRAQHLEKIIADLFASKEAFHLCNILLFVYRWTQRELHNSGISPDECRKIAELFLKYGHVLEKYVSPVNFNKAK